MPTRNCARRRHRARVLKQARLAAVGQPVENSLDPRTAGPWPGGVALTYAELAAKAAAMTRRAACPLRPAGVGLLPRPLDARGSTWVAEKVDRNGPTWPVDVRLPGIALLPRCG